VFLNLQNNLPVFLICKLIIVWLNLALKLSNVLTKMIDSCRFQWVEIIDTWAVRPSRTCSRPSRSWAASNCFWRIPFRPRPGGCWAAGSTSPWPRSCRRSPRCCCSCKGGFANEWADQINKIIEATLKDWIKSQASDLRFETFPPQSSKNKTRYDKMPNALI